MSRLMVSQDSVARRADTAVICLLAEREAAKELSGTSEGNGRKAGTIEDCGFWMIWLF